MGFDLLTDNSQIGFVINFDKIENVNNLTKN